MKNLVLPLLALLLLACEPTENKDMDNVAGTDAAPPEYALVIHGGAGTILKEDMTPEKEAGIREAMNAAMSAGEAVLEKGGTAAKMRHGRVGG